jgi:DNA polymerase I-like protein with 3'-5' exonuclease and polymerase domains
VPYISILNSALTNKARDRGWIKLLLGHKSHFNLWEVPKRDRSDPNENYSPLPLDQAKARWPDQRLERAGTYKAFNRLCQGGAAGQTKKALVEINRAIGLPQMTVHDEISKSVADREKETKLMNEIMVNCIPLLSPVRVDMEIGKTWC